MIFEKSMCIPKMLYFLSELEAAGAGAVGALGAAAGVASLLDDAEASMDEAGDVEEPAFVLLSREDFGFVWL
jgi:hypothetical protein